MKNAELFYSQAIKPKSIAIIGGGIASITLADFLYRTAPTSNITIYCQDNELASRGSGNKQGAIYPLLQGSQSVIAEFYAQCYDHAVDYYQQWFANGLQVQHGFTGVLQQAFKSELEPRLQQIAQFWPEHCQYISASKSDDIAGMPLGFPSLFFEKAGWLYPQQFCQQLAKHLTNQFGLDIVLNQSVSHLSRQNDQWIMSNNNHQIEQAFDAVVVCCGHLSNQLEQNKHIPLQSVRGQVSQLQPNSSLAPLKTVVCHKGYITPSQSEHQCFGATFIKDNNDETAHLEQQVQNLNQLKKVYVDKEWANQLSQLDIIDNKAAIRAMSPDHIPLAGELFSNTWIKQQVDKNTGKLRRLKPEESSYPNSDLPGLYTLTGLGARGLTSAPLLAEHLSAVLFGLPSPFNQRLQKAISANRFQIKHLKKNKQYI